jgi:hypothetical protein
MSSGGSCALPPVWLAALQLPIKPPSFFRFTTVELRGLAPLTPLGQVENLDGSAGSLRSLGDSPGCRTLTNIVFISGVQTTPVISQLTGPTRKRRVSPDATSAASLTLLPTPASSVGIPGPPQEECFERRGLPASVGRHHERPQS